MLLRLAGGGIEFIPVNNAYENGDKVWPVKWRDGELYSLVYKNLTQVTPKFDSRKHFWEAYEKPTFNESYIWILKP